MSDKTVRGPRSYPSHFWRAEDLGNAEMLRACFPDHVYIPHAHEAVCLGVITGGALNIGTPGKSMVAEKGDLIIVNPEEVHFGKGAAKGGWNMRTLHIAPDYLKKVSEAELGISNPDISFHGPVRKDPVLSTWLFGLHWCSETGGPPLKRGEFFHSMLARLMQRHSKTPTNALPAENDPRAVAKAREYLAAHLEDKVTLEDLAFETGSTPFRIMRAFAKSTGMTPHAWQTQARVRYAADLLKKGKRLAETAYACGFADQAHFTRTFRKVYGITPGQYLRGYACNILQ